MNIDTLCLHAGYQPKKRRTARAAHLPEHHIRIHFDRPCRQALRPRGGRAYVFAHFKSDRRLRGGKERGARGRRRRRVHHVRPVRDLPVLNEHPVRGRPLHRLRADLRRHDEPALRHNEAFRHRRHVRRLQRERRGSSTPPSARTPARCSAKRSRTPPSTYSTSSALRALRTRTACRSSWTIRSRPPFSAVRSSSARILSSTRRRSTWTDMRSSSAA